MLIGVLLVAGVPPRLLVGGILLLALLGGLVWSFGMRDYQRQRVLTFLQPDRDPRAALSDCEKSRSGRGG